MEKYDEPQIYIVNNEEITEKLCKNYYVATGNLGVTKVVNYKKNENKKYLELQYNMIDNLHEYSVIILDLQNKKEIIICEENDKPLDNKYLFELNYPKKEFIPDPLVLSIMKRRLRNQCLKIIFAGNNYTEEYSPVEVIEQNYYCNIRKEEYNVFEIINADVISKSGRKIISEDNKLANLIAKYVKEYKVVFNLPKIWDESSQQSITDTDYVSLLKNQDGEVVSYIGYSDDAGFEILLPVCENKDELIESMITSVLPEILPEFFPESKEFEWIKEEEFLPKEIKDIEKERKKVQEEFDSQNIELDKKKNEIIKKYKFLNDLLTETGQNLVEAVCKYFKWLGFNNVKLVDGSDDILREDIQIIEDDKLYIIEVKGIGGTSTDAECSQIAKHRRKRENENKGKEIIPIYIVNHQRYIRPYQRQNPPFNNDQIDYAENDERGLLTTWQLYNQYKLIESEIFTKEETRESLSKWGLISLIPKGMKKVGIIEEYFNNPKAGIIKLNNVGIKVGNEIYARRGEKWIRTKIVSIQLNDKNVDYADNGEVGIVTDIELNKGFDIFIKQIFNLY